MCREILTKPPILKFHQETMIFGDEVDVHGHPLVVLLVVSGTASETTTILIATKGEVAMIAAMCANDHSPLDPVVDFPPPKAAHTTYQTTEHLWNVG
jgi:DNA-binding MurR/RpiR family transcriptional regulator